MFREMSETELIIRSIEKVRMISIYELTGIGDDPGKACAAISIFYDKEGQINLCEFDPGFDILVDRVFELYGNLKDKASVLMDDKTRQILELGWKREEEGFLEKYYNQESSEVPDVAFESEASRRFVAFTEYLLEGFYKILGIKFEATGHKAGWRGASVIYGLQNDERVIFGLRIVQNSEAEYEVMLTNFLKQCNELTINISLENQNVLLDFSTKDKYFYGKGTFDLGVNGYTEYYEVFREGKKIFYDSKFRELKKPIVLSEEEKGLIPWDNAPKMIELPGGILYGLEKIKKDMGEYYVEEFRCVYLYRVAVYSEIRSWTRISVKKPDFSLKTMSVVMLKMGLTKGRYQTYFVPHLGVGKVRYKKELEGRFFVDKKK